MDEISKEKKKALKIAVGFDEEEENRVRRVSIIKDKKQFGVRIPKRFSEEAKIDETKDSFEFTLEKDDDGIVHLFGKLIKE